MTLQEFAPMFGLLAVQLRYADADEVAIRSYFQALKDLEFELVQAAAERIARTGGAIQADDNRHWFPKTSEWREQVEIIRRERQDAQKAALRAAKEPLCVRCDDTGWEPFQSVRNGQPYTSVKPCGCREQRRRELLGQTRPALPEAR